MIQINVVSTRLPHVVEMSLRMLCLGLGAILLAAAGAACAQTVSASRQAELIRLVRQDCGSCHGMTLRGGLGPPLTAQALKEKPPESLKAAILRGRPGTPMPPWAVFMSEADAAWIVNQLQKGFPDER